jgi:hypothetical protein
MEKLLVYLCIVAFTSCNRYYTFNSFSDTEGSNKRTSSVLRLKKNRVNFIYLPRYEKIFDESDDILLDDEPNAKDSIFHSLVISDVALKIKKSKHHVMFSDFKSNDITLSLNLGDTTLGNFIPLFGLDFFVLPYNALEDLRRSIGRGYNLIYVYQGIDKVCNQITKEIKICHKFALTCNSPNYAIEPLYYLFLERKTCLPICFRFYEVQDHGNNELILVKQELWYIKSGLCRRW